MDGEKGTAGKQLKRTDFYDVLHVPLPTLTLHNAVRHTELATTVLGRKSVCTPTTASWWFPFHLGKAA